MRFTRNELDVFDGFVLRMAVHQSPFVLLALPLIDFLQLIDPNLSIKGASGYDDTKLWSGPLDFPN